jgi:hypothetical protein
LHVVVSFQAESERNKVRHAYDGWHRAKDIPDGSREIEVRGNSVRIDHALAKSHQRSGIVSSVLAATPDPKPNTSTVFRPDCGANIRHGAQ